MSAISSFCVNVPSPSASNSAKRLPNHITDISVLAVSTNTLEQKIKAATLEAIQINLIADWILSDLPNIQVVVTAAQKHWQVLT
jgi:hypothetical protein